MITPQQIVKPIKPSEAENLKIEVIPGYVIQGFNNIIVKKLDLDRTATFTQDEVIEEILNLAPSGISRNTLFNNKWLDVEKLFRDNGWEVRYDKPGYNENYLAHFIFLDKCRINVL